MTLPRRRPKNVAKNIEDVVEPFRIRRATLAAAFPEVAIEWHYKKNCGWGPEDFNYSSNVKCWWQCPNDKSHVYAATITNRTGRQSGCMICNVGVQTDLRDYPDALAQFDVKKNPGVDPHKITWHARYHWKCSVAADHRWESTFNRRTGERCPFCKNAKLSKTNKLATFPKVAKLLHPTKNGKWNAQNLRIAESRRVWWKCPKGPDHEWRALITTKTYGSLGCPFCHGNKVSITNCLKTLYPKIAKEWHPTRNKSKTPTDVHGQTAVRYWWLCKKGHEWYQAVNIRTTRGANCPACRKN
jgi:hypothetical protein